MVTVLFCDLVGFTARAEPLDPEDVRAFIRPYYDVVTTEIERHGGVVERYLGDGVMALFGAPVAHEDDPERAVHAAMRILDRLPRLGLELHARIGINTGPVLFESGSLDQVHDSVTGDAVNTASRLQALARVDGIVVGESTHRATVAVFDYEELPSTTVKGKARPLALFRPTGPRPRPDVDPDRPLVGPFVGRVADLVRLGDVIARAGRDRRAGLVTITGPGGIGKSRLTSELERHVRELGEPIHWHRGRSPAYGDGISFWALGEMVRRRAGLAEDDDEPTTRERIAAMVATWVTADDDRHWVEPALLTLLGLEPAPAGGRDVLFAAWRILLERIAGDATSVLVFEDLHWADSGLLDFIEHLLEWSSEVPLIVIALARPELFDRRPSWLAETPSVTRLALEPLGDDEMRGLLDGMVPGLPEPAIRAILGRADGMPLYAVETVRALVSDGRLRRGADTCSTEGDLGDLAVPDTLRSLIASRLDALDPAERSLVADASVIGQAFGLAALAAVSGQAAGVLVPRLEGLARRQLFDREDDPRSPERGQYRFVHSLVSEVAHGTLARRDRRARHLAAARYYETLGDDEIAGVIASHYLAAHAASAGGAEADEIVVPARVALSAAADRAVTLGAHGQAVSYLRQAIEITEDPAARARLYLRAASSANTDASHDDALSLVGEAAAQARMAADPGAAVAAEALRGEILIDVGQSSRAVVVLENALVLLSGDGDEDGRAVLLGNLSRAYMRSGRPERSVEVADRALELAERRRLDRVTTEALNNKGSSLKRLGRREEGIALVQAAVDLARARGFVAAEIRARANLAVLMDDHPRRAWEAGAAALALARRLGDRSLSFWAASNMLDWTFLIAEGWEQALAEAGRDLADARARGIASPLAEIRSLSAQAQMRAARGESTDAALDRLEALAERTSDPFGIAAVHFLRGDRALLAGRYAEACREILAASVAPANGEVFLACATRAALWGRDVAMARGCVDRLDALPASAPVTTNDRIAARAGIAALEGRRADALSGYRDALARYRAQGRDLDLARTSLDCVMLARPDGPEARAAAAEARAVFDRVRARPYLELLEAVATRGGT